MMKKYLHLLLTATVSCMALVACGKDDGPSEPPIPGDDNPATPALKLDIPDKEGYNVKGVVYSGDTPLEGVAVSDGVTVATTDANGAYYLKSEKKRGYVFVSVPSGYGVDLNKVYPQFYRPLAKSDATEQVNFSLNAVPDNDYVVMYLADIHLAGRNQDDKQYNNLFVADINRLIADYKAAGKDVYCMTLGDQSWNTYWYSNASNPFTLTQVKPFLEKIDAPVFNTMGNHDHDPIEKEDFRSEKFWMTEIGPTYYSFNIGKVHYIVLDNILFDNPTLKVSDECYTYCLTDEQRAWLKADLAVIKDKNTPIHILAHAPLHKKPKLNASGVADNKFHWTDGTEFVKLFSGFKAVTVFTGHTHVNYAMSDATASNVWEYNVASVCANWWLTGKSKPYPGNHICRDGSIGGYRVVEVSGNDVKTYFKSLNCARDYQFRTYDVNESRITAAKYCTSSNDSNIATEIEALTGAAGAVNTQGSNWHKANTNNEVVINIFAWDPRWKIEVTESGRKLDVKQENGYDPLHFISAMCPRLQEGSKVTSMYQPTLTSHMFRVKASSATSTLDIKVTDQDGNVYTETMTRPKALSTDMK